MITKLATFSGVSSAGEPLVHLFHPGEGLRKHAGVLQPPIQDWLDGYRAEPGKIAVLVNAMGASEYWGQNNNGDAFSEGALAHDCSQHPHIAHPYDEFAGKVIPPYGYPTFLEALPFVHHRNKDPTRAFGKVAVSCYNPRMHRIEIVVIIDEALAMLHGAQSVVDRIKAGEYPDVSMGTRVPYDVCLICGNKARTRKEYCPCIKHIGMNKILEDGRQIGVDNPHPRFFDISFVFIGADRTAKMMCKFASAQNVPLSVLEADAVYNIPLTPDGLVKAACSKKACTECRGGCKVAQVDLGTAGKAGLVSGAGGAVGVGLLDLAARRKLDPRLARTMARAAAEWGTAGGVTAGLAPYVMKTGAKEWPDDPAAQQALVKGWADQIRAAAKQYKEAGAVCRKCGTAKKETENGVECGCGVKIASKWKIGPPPMPNREKFPFVGTINFRGLKIGVENAPGTWRTGNGWKTLMKVPYGEFLHGKAGGTDGDKLDVFVGPSRTCENVFIIHQNFVRGPKKGQYDEDKVMLGFDTPAQAKKTYLAHYDTDKFFRSMTTMAFPLFKRALMGGEVDGEKVASLPYDDEGHGHIFPRSDGVKMRHDWRKCARCVADKKRRDEMLKTAASLEDLFSGASKSERRKRTWKDKVTGEEETVTGSGINKQASAVRPEAIKLAMVLKHGFTPDELLKVSNHPKTAAHLKWADILKEVGPSKAVGRVAPLLESTEPDFPTDLLNDMGERPCLEESLATPAAMGMVLKPREFQRIMLARMGRHGLADELDRAGAVFPSCEGHLPVCGSLMPHHVSGDIMDLLAPFLGERSYFGPVVRRRIIRIAVARPRVSTPLELDTPLLTKVGQAYNWYRNEQLSMLTSPDRLKTAAKVNPKTGLTPAGAALVLGSVPLALMYSVYQAHQKNKGKDLGALDNFAAEHPWFVSAGTGTLVAAALRDPKIGKALRDAFKHA